MKVYNKEEHYTGTQVSLVNRFSRDCVSKDLGSIKFRAGADTWNLKVNCIASLITDEIGVERGRAADRRAKRRR